MKKIILAATAAMLTLSVVGCKDVVDKSANGSNINFEDSVADYSGSLMGTMFRQHLDNPQADVKFNKSEVMRGIRDVMATDTSNVSYIIGLQMGMSAFQTYQALSKDVDINRADYMKAITATMNADSIADIDQLRSVFMSLQTQIEERARQRQEEEAYNSEQAQENRKAQETAFTAIKNDDNYKALADGIYCQVLKAGNGTKLTDGEKVMVQFQVDNLTGDKAFGNMNNARPMTVGHASLPVLNTLLPYMEMGESAKFYVPWEKAWGKAGLPQSGIGPCQAVVVTLVTEPADAK